MREPEPERNRFCFDSGERVCPSSTQRDVVPQLRSEAELRGFHPRTLSTDKAHDARPYVAKMREHGVTPHVA